MSQQQRWFLALFIYQIHGNLIPKPLLLGAKIRLCRVRKRLVSYHYSPSNFCAANFGSHIIRSGALPQSDLVQMAREA